jgi:flagellin
MSLTIGSSSNLLQILSAMQRNNAERAVTLARLATGRRINKGSDDPAGLIAATSLESEQAGVDAALANNQRTKSMLDTADGAMMQVSGLLSDIERLAVASAGSTASAAEKAANQAQIDSAVDAIDRIMGSTTFNGQKIFGGQNNIEATMTAADAADIRDVRAYSRPTDSSSVTLEVNVTAAAKRATTSGTSIANVTAALSADTVVSISGKDGTQTVTLASGSSLASVISTINGVKGLTGVSATSSGTQLKLTSVDYGADAFVSVSALSGDVDFTSSAHVAREKGTDATVTVNGQAALTSGTEIYYNGGGVSLSANLASNTTGKRTLTISGGGATFQLGASASDQATVGIPGLDSHSLGRSDLGYLSDLKSGGSASIATDPAAAANIAHLAVKQAATATARLGGFQKYQVDATIGALNAMKEGLSAAISSIRDTDMAAETANLQRQNLLASFGTSLLDVVNQQQQQSILALLQ